MKNSWNEAEKDYIRQNLHKTSREIAAELGRSVYATNLMIYRLGLNRNSVTPRSGIKSVFSESDIQFIRENIDCLTNAQIAKQLEKTLTVVRNKIYELGLKRTVKPQEWTPEQVDFLVENYQTIGDVELGEIMNKRFPSSQRQFGRKTINKKRQILDLKRNKDEIEAIRGAEEHKARCNTIRRNSGSLNYKDGWVALTLSGKAKPELAKTFLKYPALIELRREQLKLNRALKQLKNEHSNTTIS